MKTKFLCLFFVVILLLSIMPILAEEIINLNQDSDVIILNSNSERFNLFDFFRNLFKIKEKPKQALVLLDVEEQDTFSNLDFSSEGEEDNVDDFVMMNSLSSSSRSSRKSSSSSKSSSSKSSDSGDVVNEETENFVLEVAEEEENFGVSSFGSSSPVIDTTSLDEEEENPFEVKSVDESDKMQIMSIVDPDRISFSPPLPSSVCENEKIDITVKGRAKFYPDVAQVIDCVWDDKVWVVVKLRLMESDAWPNPDDEVAVEFPGGYSYYPCDSIYFERTFTNVDLSDWIIPDAGNNGEFYARVDDNWEYDIGSLSTLTYKVALSECECTSGVCCDLSTKKFKSSGSQPTGKTDYYFCSATNSPTSTNYVKKRDYYCTGSSSSYTWSDSIKDTCGTCEYCTFGDSTCNYYGTSTSCGTKDCDYLESSYPCRDYSDVDKYCSSGSCISPSCNDYINRPKGTSCGSGKECNAYGTCITCTSHSYTKCYNNDVYYFDKCDNREERASDCGEDYCNLWKGKFCKGDELWKKRDCYNKWCSAGYCRIEKWEDEEKIETCEYGCEGEAHCNSNPDIECYDKYDCLAEWSNPFCETSSGVSQVKKRRSIYECVNPGTTSSSCEFDYTGYQIVENCGEIEYSDNYCLDNDVYRDFIDKCSSGVCFEQSPVEQIVQYCIYGCTDGECNEPTCTNECSSGQTTCNGDYKQTCGNYDIDSCLEWGGNEDCPHGCENAECKKPDLIVTDFNNYLTRDKEVFVSFTIQNIGTAIAENVYWMIDTGSGDKNPERTSARILDAGGWTRAVMKIVYLHPGTYYPKVIVDHDNLVSETNEDNNEQTILVTV